MSSGRQLVATITWDSIEISKDIAPYLLELDYTDNLTSAADDLSIVLEDRDGLWSGDWRPVFGDTATARIKAEPWLTQVTDLNIGTFAHDKFALSGGNSGKVANLKCVSAPLATGLRRRKRTKGHSGVTLKQIAQDIADRAGLTLLWDGDAGLTYKRREQRDKSDLEFLEEACKEVGRNLKVTQDPNSQGYSLAIFDELTRDSAESVGSLDLHGGRVLEYSFDGDDSGRYGSCHINFYDPRTGKTAPGQYPPDGVTVPGLDANGQTLEVRMSIESRGEATAKAKALLRNANRFGTSGKLVTVGDPGLVAGVTFDLVNAYGFSGKYIITKATHHCVGGYTCSLDVRLCLVGY